MTDKNDTTQWKRMRFKRNKVWVALGENRQPQVEKGKVLIKYQLDQPHQYRVHPASLHPLDDMTDGKSASSSESPANRKPETPVQKPAALKKDKAICIYTDGASSGNPGPAGIGVVMVYKEKRKELSCSIGTATNNAAELEAIRLGLSAVKNRRMPVIVFTDSRYALGVLTLGWKVTLNQELVADTRRLLAKFKKVQFIKVKAHSGHPENERADQLAVQGIGNSHCS